MIDVVVIFLSLSLHIFAINVARAWTTDKICKWALSDNDLSY